MIILLFRHGEVGPKPSGNFVKHHENCKIIRIKIKNEREKQGKKIISMDT